MKMKNVEAVVSAISIKICFEIELAGDAERLDKDRPHFLSG